MLTFYEFKPYARRVFDQVTTILESGVQSREVLEEEFNARDLDTVLMMAENGYALTDLDIDGFELPENFWDKAYKFWKECDQ